MHRHQRILLGTSLLSLILALGLSLGSGALYAGCGNGSEGGERPQEGSSQGAEGGDRVHGLTKTQAGQTLAKVGDRTITVGEFAEHLASKGTYLRARYNSPERRRELLDQMIRFELLAQEALRRGYGDRPEVARSRKQMMIRRFIKARYEDRSSADDIPEAEVRAFYDSHRTDYHTPAQVRASHILMRDRAAAQRVLAQLLAAPNDIRLYRQLAEQNNIDPDTRDRFGDLRFFAETAGEVPNEPDVPEAVRRAAFGIERIGGVHPELVQTDRGFHIVKLTGRRAAMHRAYQEASRSIRNRLFREQRESAIQELIDRLRREAEVEEHFDLLDQVHVDLPEGLDAPPPNPPPPGGLPGRPLPGEARPSPLPPRPEHPPTPRAPQRGPQ